MRIIINNEVIGHTINKLREENDVSLDDLSLQAGIAKKTLICYEFGDKQISIKDAIAICNFFNIKLDDLVSYQVFRY